MREKTRYVKIKHIKVILMLCDMCYKIIGTSKNNWIGNTHKISFHKIFKNCW